MNQFWNSLSPQVQIEIVKFLKTLTVIVAGSLVMLAVKFKVHSEHAKPNEKKTTVIEFDGGFQKKK